MRNLIPPMVAIAGCLSFYLLLAPKDTQKKTLLREGVTRYEALLLPVRTVEKLPATDDEHDGFLVTYALHPSDFTTGKIPKYLDICVIRDHEFMKKLVITRFARAWVQNADGLKELDMPPAQSMFQSGGFLWQVPEPDKDYVFGILVRTKNKEDAESLDDIKKRIRVWRGALEVYVLAQEKHLQK